MCESVVVFTFLLAPQKKAVKKNKSPFFCIGGVNFYVKLKNFFVKLKCVENHEMEVESIISTSSATTASIILARNNSPQQTPPRNNSPQTPPRRRRSSSSTSSHSPGAKENSKSLQNFKNSGSDPNNSSKVGTKRKRTESAPSKCEKFKEKLTFWGWSPKKAKFKPKIMDERGELTDHPDPTAAIRSKWQPIVNN